MSNIDKEWLKQKIADMESTRDDIPFGLGEDGTNTLAALRIALALLEAGPVSECHHEWSFGGKNKLQSQKQCVKCGRVELVESPAQASLEAEPVAWLVMSSQGQYVEFDNEHGGVPLFATPPAPVSVPDEREAFNAWNNDTDCPLAGRDAKTAAWLAWCRRAAMLHGGKP